jgi:cyclomaltodextrin glucanotransferase
MRILARFVTILSNAAMFAAIATTGPVASAKPPRPVDIGELEDKGAHRNDWFRHHDPASTTPPKAIGNEVIYQVFVDRFANGNKSNDCLHEGRFCDPRQKNFFKYFGGDIRGIINHLPYIKRLGATRLWLTPVFENQHVVVPFTRNGKQVSVTSYHGYWMADAFRLNPFFTDKGSQDFAIMEELGRKAGPELGIYMDTVNNHTNPANASIESLEYLQRVKPVPGLTPAARAGSLFRDGEFMASLGSRDGWFHGFGPIEDFNDTFQLENHQLAYLADLDQTVPEVRKYLFDSHDFWLEKVPNLAGFRFDAVRHVPTLFWQDLEGYLDKRYGRMENIGEFYGEWTGLPTFRDFYRRNRMTLFDFELRWAAKKVFMEDASFDLLPRLWSADPELGDARGIVTFIDNHDMPRLRGEGLEARRMRQTIALMFAMRGVPCVYYGLEQDLFVPGENGDPYNRPMMQSFDENHEFYRLIHRLSSLRKSNPALRYGATHLVHLTKHIVAFERVDGEHKVFFATSKNPRSGADHFEIRDLSMPDGRYQDVLTGREYDIRGGTLPVQLADGDLIVLSTTRKKRST